MLAQIAKCHQRSQQDTQRQCQRQQTQCGMEEKLSYQVHAQALANQLVDVTPQELHHHDKEADAEGHQKPRQEPRQHECV